MQRITTFVTLIVCLFPVSLFGRGKFERVIVFPGGAMNPALFVGLYDAAVTSGWKPDVIVATCGGALSAAVIKTLPDRKERLNYLESKEFYDLFKLVKINQIYSSSDRFQRFFKVRTGGETAFPQILAGSALTIPDEINGSIFQKNLDSTGLRLVIVGSKALFNVDEIGKRVTKKMWKEIFFTDEDTGKLLSNFKSIIARDFPESYLEHGTDVITDITLSKAVRISITEPYLFDPLQINEKYFFGGMIDLIPLEASHALGKEIAIPYPDELWGAGAGVAKNAYKFDINERVRRVAMNWANYWIDFSKIHDEWNSFSFMPSLEYQLKFVGGESIGILPLPLINLVPVFINNIPEPDKDNPNGVPKEFIRKIRAQYEYGYIKGLEAFKTRIFNDKRHIRDPIN